MEIGIGRRFGVAAVALACSAILFHGQIASLLTTRGDDLTRTGRLDRAASMYSRALVLDPRSVIAADRLAFLGIRLHTQAGYRLAESVASGSLAYHPQEPRLLLDRALAEEHLGAFAEALADFDRLSIVEPDARTFEFAARMALRIHNRRAAHERFRRVLALDTRFVSARQGFEATR